MDSMVLRAKCKSSTFASTSATAMGSATWDSANATKVWGHIMIGHPMPSSYDGNSSWNNQVGMGTIALGRRRACLLSPASSRNAVGSAAMSERQSRPSNLLPNPLGSIPSFTYMTWSHCTPRNYCSIGYPAPGAPIGATRGPTTRLCLQTSGCTPWINCCTNSSRRVNTGL